MRALNFVADEILDQYAPLRREIREFLRDDPSLRQPRADAWVRCDRGFSQRLGRRGFIGMTWPAQYGGGGRTMLERYVVTEEICVAGAPGGGHWSGDRQIGALLLRFGTEEQRRTYLPQLARGDISFSLGMSEPGSGSDLASVRTRAERTAHGWRINGHKIWTTNAHHASFVLILCRTGQGDRKTDGLSQIIVPLHAEGVSIVPVRNIAGEHEFNELLFDDVVVPAGNLVGTEGHGWMQVGNELALERSGPERFLSSYVLLRALIDHWAGTRTPMQAGLVGDLIAQLVTLRGMSVSVAAIIGRGGSANVEAAHVKELGALFEQRIAELAVEALEEEPDPTSGRRLAWLVADTVLRAPSFSLRGGTREILRGIIARDLGLR